MTGSGAAWCWGENDAGQLGDGTLLNSIMPVAVSGLASGVNSIATGGVHSCAITSGGGVKCWGYNYNGQLGDGSWASTSTPVNVSGLTSGVDRGCGRGLSYLCLDSQRWCQVLGLQ